MAAITREHRPLGGTRVALWMLMLGLGQLADLLTTQAAMARGAVSTSVDAEPADVRQFHRREGRMPARSLPYVSD